MKQLTNKLSGGSLIEILISLVMGLIIVAGASVMYVNTLAAQKEITASAKLNQELGAVMHILVNDIRRSGYTKCVDNPSIPFSCPEGEERVLYEDNEDINVVSSTCILYAYNSNSDNIKNADERFGFKLKDNQIMMRSSCGTDVSFDAPVTSCSTDCLQGTWGYLSDSNTNNAISITGFTLNSYDSKCHNIDDHDTWRINPTVTSATEFSCLEADSGNFTDLEVLDILTTPPSWTAASSSLEPDDEERTVGIRHVSIDLRGELVSHSNVSKYLNSSIKIRNDRIRKYIKP